MKKVFIIGLLVIITTGCSIGVSESVSSNILKNMEKSGLLSKNREKVGTSKVVSGRIDDTYLYNQVDVYKMDDKLVSISVRKPLDKKDTEVCNYYVTIYDKVEFLKDQEVEEYNNETNQGEIVVKDIYSTDNYSYDKYCVKTIKSLFGLKYEFIKTK